MVLDRLQRSKGWRAADVDVGIDNQHKTMKGMGWHIADF